MTPLQSQALGFCLAMMTAIGTIAYERLVKAYSLGVILTVTMSFYVPVLIVLFAKGWTTLGEVTNACKEHPWAVFIYWITWLTTPIWYIIARAQGAMVGAIYDVKYIVMLALIYVFFGENKFTWNIAAGLCCALASFFFISRK